MQSSTILFVVCVTIFIVYIIIILKKSEKFVYMNEDTAYTETRTLELPPVHSLGPNQSEEEISETEIPQSLNHNGSGFTFHRSVFKANMNPTSLKDNYGVGFTGVF
jgi:hypothetical protein